MHALSQSAFLQALGYAIANSLWQAALLWLLAAALNGLKMPSQIKYKAALAAQFGLFAWFIVTLQFYYQRCSEAVAQWHHAGLTNNNALVLRPGVHSFASAMLSVMLKGEMLLPYLSVAYLCLLIAQAVRWIKGYRQTLLIKTTGLQKIDIEWRLFVKKIAHMLAIKPQVSIYISELVKSPLTVGFLKPMILVPLASINNLTTYQLEAIILHELAHIKRADYFINIIQSVIETALFFNPFTQLLSKMICRERENSCDDWVLQFQYDPARYAEALLRIAYMQQSPALAMNAAGKETDLLWRVKRMLNQKERSFQYRNRLLALLLITGLLTSVAWLNPGVKTETASQQTIPGQPVVEEPMAAKIDNMWFNPVSFLNKPLQEEVDKAVEYAKSGMDTVTQLALHKTTSALQKVTPEVLESLKGVNENLPQILNDASTSATTAVNNININNETNTELSGLKDSLNVGKLIKLAFNEGLKNIDWKELNNGLSESQKDLKKALNIKDFRVATSSKKMDEIIAKSFNQVKNSIFKVNVSAGDNNKANKMGEDRDDDDAQTTITAPIVATINAPANTRAQNEKTRRLILEATRRRTDSLRKTYSRIKLNTSNSVDLYANISKQFDAQAKATPAVGATGYGYSTLAYIPVKFNGEVPFNLSLGQANDLSVSAKENSTLIAVKEDADNDGSYKKHITIETLDNTGQKHTYHITIEMYQ